MIYALGTRIGGASAWMVGVAAWLLAAAPALADEGNAETGSRTGDLGQAFMILAVFGTLMFILGKYAWKPIIAQLQRREKEIGERLHDTDRRNRDAKELEAHYHARLDRADAEAKQLLAKSLEEAARAREELLASARDEGSNTIEAAKDEIEQFKKVAIEELQQATAKMAVSIAREIIQDQLNPEKQKELIEQSLRRIRARADKESG